MSDQTDTVERDETEPQGELFEGGVLEGDAITLGGNLLKTTGDAARRVENKVKMTNHECVMRGGLLNPCRTVRVLASCRVIDYNEHPHWEKQDDGQDKITSWTFKTTLSPFYMETMEVGIPGVLRLFEEAIAKDSDEAGKMLDALNERYTEYLRNGEHR